MEGYIITELVDKRQLLGFFVLRLDTTTTNWAKKLVLLSGMKNLKYLAIHGYAISLVPDLGHVRCLVPDKTTVVEMPQVSNT